MKCLKEIRLQSAMTANAVAEHLGILYRTYQKYESGEIDPQLSKAIVLADLFDVSLDYLVWRSDEPRRI